MAIKIKVEATETELFCSSKWWGDPDLPADMEYPTVQVEDEDGVYDYPLTFLCQIDCEDLAPFDPDGLLPHQGMFYLFAGIDEYLGWGSPFHNGPGEWARRQVVVKYTKTINFETFRSAILVDDEDQPLTEKALKMTFEACGESDDCTKLLGLPTGARLPEDDAASVNFLQIDSGTAGIRFPEEGRLNLLYKKADLAAGKWKLLKAFLT